jgi:transposase
VIGSTRRVQVFAYAAAADMRKGFEGLSGLVREELKRDPLSGEMFLFSNRRRNRAKVLVWDGTGMCVYAKRLERGKFACLWSRGNSTSVQLSMTELQLFLEESELVGRRRLSPPEISAAELAVPI